MTGSGATRSRRRPVTRWLRGSAFASPYGSSVRLGMETNSGTRAEVYLTRTQARQLRDALNHIVEGK